MDGCCRDCTYWLRIEFDPDELPFGECREIEVDDFATSLATIVDRQSDTATLVTMDSFGCVLFEPRETVA